MAHLFYFFGVILFLLEIMVLFNVKKVESGIKNFKQRVKEEGSENLEKIMSKDMALYMILNTLYMFWAVMGLLFTSQRLLFLFLFIISFVTDYIKKHSDEKHHINIRTFDALICLCILGTLISNHFH